MSDAQPTLAELIARSRELIDLSDQMRKRAQAIEARSDELRRRSQNLVVHSQTTWRQIPWPHKKVTINVIGLCKGHCAISRLALEH
jgi:hypothetical protein